ncbi:PRC-barrel domain-containing protein [Prochlorococcus sp. AH-716-B23]|nr:PRC-barrel domain-containing protein [Prochlorococcus sp. AH-716-B23]
MSLSNTSTNNNGRNSVPSERLWLRSELMGTQVITTDTGRRLGVVGEVVVDIDRREVVALGLRDNPLTRFLPGLPKWMPLESIKQVGDVILVDSLDSLSDGFSPERYGKVINCQVITESGQLLGRVLGFSFDIETGDLISLVMGAVGVPMLGEGVLSTWEIPVDEIVSSGTDRIIVYEGAEEKLNQLSSGLLEKLGVGGSSWEEREANRYTANLVPVENQLLSGSESEEQNNFMEEIKEEEFIEEEEYEEELEYVEIETTKEKINNKKQLYLDNDSSEQLDNQTDEENSTEFAVQRPSISNRASKRPIQRSQEPLDIEPVEEKKTVIEKSQSESVEIDDPW